MNSSSLSARNRFVIWGSKGHGRVLLDVISARRHEVVALFDNDVRAQSICPSVPVIIGMEGFRRWLKTADTSSGLAAAIAIGGNRGRDRELIALSLEECGINLPAIIHSDSSVSSSAVIRHGAHVLANAVVAAGTVVGPHTIVNNAACVDHECFLGIGVHIAPGAVLCGCVTVGNYAFVGAGAVVLPRIRIGDGATVGAGATVTRDVSPGDTVVGCPARSVAKADS